MAATSAAGGGSDGGDRGEGLRAGAEGCTSMRYGLSGRQLRQETARQPLRHASATPRRCTDIGIQSQVNNAGLDSQPLCQMRYLKHF
jgi:hypothetical protein